MPDLFDSFTLDRHLATGRVILRPLNAADAADLHRHINDWDICRRLSNVPFPYAAADAAAWIAETAQDRAAGRGEHFAITDAASGALIGGAGLRIAGKTAELGYWLGRAFWGGGYGTEAVRRLVEWGFATLPLEKITATVAADNDVSAALLERLGFRQTGKGSKIFLCRPGQKLPVRFYALERDVPESAAPSSVLLVVAAALIDAEGRVLLARRPAGKKMAGLWEFPGGKLEPGETPEAGLARELGEELGIAVNPADLAPFIFASHAYEKFHLLMPVFLCRRWRGTPAGREGQALAWVAPAELPEYPMPPADRPIIPFLRDFL
jgi:8-oxo-dGTP diphosphatase